MIPLLAAIRAFEPIFLIGNRRYRSEKSKPKDIS
jgi:hypothetical protein